MTGAAVGASEGAAVRLAVVGAGRWGANCIRTIEGLEDAQVVAIATRTSRPPLPAECTHTTDWRDLLPGGALGGLVDGVVVTTPPATHAEIARAFLEAGIAAFVEKPLTPSLTSTLALAEAVGGRERLLLVDHVHLFHRAYEPLREAVRADGGALAAWSEGGDSGPGRPDVGALWDYGPHDASLLLDLLGPLAVESVRHEAPAAGGGREAWTVRATADGIPAYITTGNGLAEKRRRLAVRTARALWVLDDLDAQPLRRYPVPRAAGAGWPVEAGASGTPVPIDDAGLPLTRALEAFARGIREGDGDGRWGLALPVAVARLLDAVERASSEGPAAGHGS